MSPRGGKPPSHPETPGVNARPDLFARPLDACRPGKVQRLEDGRELVAAHVAQRPRAEVAPVAPSPGMVGGMVRALGRRTQPEVPVQSIGHGRHLRQHSAPSRLLPERGAHRDVDFGDRPEHAVEDILLHHPGFFRRLALVAQLGGRARALRRFGDLAGFGDRVGERLLAIDVLAPAESRQRHHGVAVVGRGHHHRVHVLLIEQFAVIAIGAATSVAAPLAIDVADGGDLHLVEREEIEQVHVPLTAQADAGQHRLLAGRNGALAAQYAPGNDRQDRRPRRAPQERAPRHFPAEPWHCLVSWKLDGSSHFPRIMALRVSGANAAQTRASSTRAILPGRQCFQSAGCVILGIYAPPQERCETNRVRKCFSGISLRRILPSRRRFCWREGFRRFARHARAWIETPQPLKKAARSTVDGPGVVIKLFLRITRFLEKRHGCAAATCG
jgi:hypothetical protein